MELDIIFLSVRVALLNTLFTLPVSLWLGWVLARKDFTGKSILETLIFLPLVTPPIVTGYLLLIVFGKNGIIGQYLYQWFNIKLVFNFSALVLASVIVSLPLAVRSMKSAFARIDPEYEKVALTLGATRFCIFFKIIMPLSFPGLMNGMVLSFARSLGEFGATITLAGNIPGKTQTIAMVIYTNMQIPGKEFQVIRFVVISLLLSFITLLLSEYLQKKRGNLF